MSGDSEGKILGKKKKKKYFKFNKNKNLFFNF
jgi:hypothetical protein